MTIAYLIYFILYIATMTLIFSLGVVMHYVVLYRRFVSEIRRNYSTLMHDDNVSIQQALGEAGLRARLHFISISLPTTAALLRNTETDYINENGYEKEIRI